MSWIRRLRSLFETQKLEDQLDEELQFHIDTRTQEFIATGMAPEEVRMTAPKAEGPEEDADFLYRPKPGRRPSQHPASASAELWIEIRELRCSGTI